MSLQIEIVIFYKLQSKVPGIVFNLTQYCISISVLLLIPDVQSMLLVSGIAFTLGDARQII